MFTSCQHSHKNLCMNLSLLSSTIIVPSATFNLHAAMNCKLLQSRNASELTGFVDCYSPGRQDDDPAKLPRIQCCHSRLSKLQNSASKGERCARRQGEILHRQGEYSFCMYNNGSRSFMPGCIAKLHIQLSLRQEGLNT